MRMQEAITKNSFLLAAFALLVAAGIASTEISTRLARAESLRQVQSKALEEIIPKAQHDNSLLDDFLMTDDQSLLKLKQPAKIHISRLQGEVNAFIFPVRAPDGYGGSIDSIVGIRTDGTVAGVRIISHSETPGLGDKIELKKSDWVLAFNDKSINNPEQKKWAVKKDKGIFDQFTGATITPRAVINSIYNSLLFFQTNKASLLAQAQPETEEKPSPEIIDSTANLTLEPKI
ncbi:MAG: electron transport complex subunit RsxG [Pseudomonadales bacterium]|nr:electron transport complex subunit RsxG [Pseudomonadales bacterium]